MSETLELKAAWMSEFAPRYSYKDAPSTEEVVDYLRYLLGKASAAAHDLRHVAATCKRTLNPETDLREGPGRFDDVVGLAYACGEIEAAALALDRVLALCAYDVLLATGHELTLQTEGPLEGVHDVRVRNLAVNYLRGGVEALEEQFGLLDRNLPAILGGEPSGGPVGSLERNHRYFGVAAPLLDTISRAVGHIAAIWRVV